MKIATRLTLFLMLGITLVLAAYAGLTASRELGLFESDMVHDHAVLGRALARSAALVWDSSGEDEAVRMVAVANARDDMHVSWHAPSDGVSVPHVPEEVHLHTLRDDRSVLASFYPVTHEGKLAAWIEIDESLKSRDRYVRTSLITTFATAGVIAALSTILAGFLGLTLVGRPVRALTEQARRVGRGDLSERVRSTRRDELGELGVELDTMCDRLEEANQRVENATRARITALEQLRHADRLMTVGKLASGVAHEIGTPLNVVSGRARMIERNQVAPEAIGENARIIHQQAERIAGIVRQLLDFARVRGPRASSTDLVALARQTVALLQPLAAKQKVDLLVEADPNTPKVEVDQGQVQQVLTNLIVNGIQAMYAPGCVKIVLGPAPEKPAFVRIAVRDSGHGMAEETLEHVFEPFFTTKSVGEGTGLGLSVAYGIVREHGGTIQVESELSVGTTFTVFLPLGGRA